MSIKAIEEAAEDEGIEPGTKAFAHRVNQLKVIYCREMMSVYSCTECPNYDWCELIKQVLRDNEE